MRPGHGLLRDWREKSGLSQAAVGQLCGVKQATVSDWEAGNKCPGLEAGTRLAVASGDEVPATSWFEVADDEASGVKLATTDEVA